MLFTVECDPVSTLQVRPPPVTPVIVVADPNPHRPNNTIKAFEGTVTLVVIAIPEPPGSLDTGVAMLAGVEIGI